MSNIVTNDAESTELERLRTHIAELEQKLAGAEQTLQRYTNILQHLHIGLHVYHLPDINDDQTLRMVDVNLAAESMTGLSAVQVLGKTIDENFPNLRERGIPQAYAEVVRTGQPMEIEDLYYSDARVLQVAFAVHAFPLPDQHLGVTFEVITDHKRAEQRLQALINRLPIIQFALDRDGIFTLSEGQSLTLLGLQPGQVVGLSVFDLYREMPDILDNLRRCLDGESVRYRSKVGEITFDTICNPVYDEQGHLSGAAGIGIDINDIVRTEQERAHLMAIIENTPDVISMADTQGKIVYMNHAGRRFFGLTDDEDLSTKHIPDLHPTWASELVQNQGISEAIRTGFWSGDTALYNAQGAEIPVSQVILAHKNVAGEVEFFSVIMRDISERQQVETALRSSEQRLTQFLDALPVGVSVIKPDGQPFYVNQAAINILGKGIVAHVSADQPAEVYGVYVAGTEEPYPIVQMPLIRALAGERSTVDDMEIQQPDRRVLLEVYGAPILNADGTVAYALAVFIDITLRKQAEAALREHAIQQEIIRAQFATLQELSTPLLTIDDQTIVLPLIGSVDSRRAQQVMETLLNGVAATRAETAIIDITGVSIVDTQVANALIQAAQAIGLLGAQAVITGIRPEIAQTLVGLGVDLSQVVTRSSLQSGIAFALGR